MPNSGYDGYCASRNRPRHALVVEPVQVFPASTATSDNDHIRVFRMRRKPSHPGRDFNSAAGALYRCCVDQKIHRRMAPAEALS